MAKEKLENKLKRSWWRCNRYPQGHWKITKTKAGWTLPGHRYTGPYNDLENQVTSNPETGEILEIYDPPTWPTDAVAMQHDVDYSVCADNRKCKNKADRKW